jgi:hypothetical protein
MHVRDAAPDDWPAIWRILRRVIAAGETFAVDRDLGEEQARAWWMHGPPGRTVVAVADGGTVLGTAEIHPTTAARPVTSPMPVSPSGRAGDGRPLRR